MQKIMGCKGRLYPTPEQAQQINQTIGNCRFIYNYMLARQQKIYRRRGEHMSYISMQNLLPGMKKYIPWLASSDSQALKYACRQLNDAYQRYFKGLGDKPRFKSKKRSDGQSYTTTKGSAIHVLDGAVKLPLLGIVRCKGLRKLDGKISKATIRRTPSGKYFVSILYTIEVDDPAPVDGMVGLDVGIKEFAVDSNNVHYENPKYLSKSLKKLRREQRRLSRKEKGSKSRDKQRVKVARVHERIANQRSDHHHKLSRKLVDENQIIGVEDLNIKGMVCNHKLARCISDAAWGNFLRMLEYKAAWSGRTLVKIPTFYPSSQTCSCCGYQNRAVKDLSVREWVCPVCGANHQRDENASQNILRETLYILLVKELRRLSHPAA